MFGNRNLLDPKILDTLDFVELFLLFCTGNLIFENVYSSKHLKINDNKGIFHFVSPFINSPEF